MTRAALLNGAVSIRPTGVIRWNTMNIMNSLGLGDRGLFKVLSKHSPAETEEKYENFQLAGL